MQGVVITHKGHTLSTVRLSNLSNKAIYYHFPMTYLPLKKLKVQIHQKPERNLSHCEPRRGPQHNVHFPAVLAPPHNTRFIKTFNDLCIQNPLVSCVTCYIIYHTSYYSDLDYNYYKSSLTKSCISIYFFSEKLESKLDYNTHVICN